MLDSSSIRPIREENIDILLPWSLTTPVIKEGIPILIDYIKSDLTKPFFRVIARIFLYPLFVLFVVFDLNEDSMVWQLCHYINSFHRWSC